MDERARKAGSASMVEVSLAGTLVGTRMGNSTLSEWYWALCLSLVEVLHSHQGQAQGPQSPPQPPPVPTPSEKPTAVRGTGAVIDSIDIAHLGDMFE